VIDCIIVENHADTREAEAEYLSHCGFEVRPADGGEALWTLIEERVPDVIVMDLKLPSVDGWELTRQIRADQRTRNVPIAVVSASVSSDDRDRALASGANVFLSKPCDPEEIAATLTGLVAQAAK
jgi:chemosensory pili system protein ChpA (sensor histidine kinase/response regulator)